MNYLKKKKKLKANNSFFLKFIFIINKNNCKYTGSILTQHHSKAPKLQKSRSSIKSEKENILEADIHSRSFFIKKSF